MTGNDIQNHDTGVSLVSADVKFEHNRIRLNNDGISIQIGDSKTPDLGGGRFPSKGHNIIVSNTGNDLVLGTFVESNVIVFVEQNCWDNAPPSNGDFVGADIFIEAGGINTTIATNGAMTADASACSFP